jgi:serine/threonine-protein kinase RsbW
MQTTAEQTWKIPNRMEALADVGRKVLDWLAELPLSTRAKYSAALAIEEMTTNIIKYGYDDLAEHTIRIQVVLDNSHLKLVFEDDGHPFDPTQRPAPDIENIIESRKSGGLGIELVRRMCEKMVYERVKNLNRLTLHIRRLQPDDTQFISLSML